MDFLKKDYMHYVEQYHIAKAKYEAVIRELQHVDILLKTDWAKRLLEETAEECLNYKERIDDICVEIDRETLHKWGKEYVGMLENLEYHYMN